jgi:hypothetical protein
MCTLLLKLYCEGTRSRCRVTSYASPMLKKSRDLLFSRLVLLNYVSKSRDFLYICRDLFFAPILVQSRVFLSLVSERELVHFLLT